MIVSTSIEKVQSITSKVKSRDRSIGFIPTMGALHLGHLSLVKVARKKCDFVVVSIFVNPIQFRPNEDFNRYPKTLADDKKLLASSGVNLVFCPSTKAMYNSGFSTYVDEKILSKALCGKSRPGHFSGVATVIAKLMNIVNPSVVYFGQKDYQQALIARRLLSDLNFPAKIKILSIIREKDNLAFSSRNAYLSNSERKQSLCLFQALSLAKLLIAKGEKRPEIVIKEMHKIIDANKAARVDYIEVFEAESLRKLKRIKGKILIALAVYIGKTRLIDNIILNVKS